MISLVLAVLTATAFASPSIPKLDGGFMLNVEAVNVDNKMQSIQSFSKPSVRLNKHVTSSIKFVDENSVGLTINVDDFSVDEDGIDEGKDYNLLGDITYSYLDDRGKLIRQHKFIDYDGNFIDKLTHT